MEVLVGLEGSGEGSVVSDPPGIDCPDADCSLLVAPGTQITLTAQAVEPWSSFIGWSGDVDCPGTGSCTVNADDFIHATATFEPSSEVFVELEGSGEGSVVSDPPGIDCPDTECSLLVAPGIQVTLTAQAADPWFSFTGWGGDVDCPGTGPCTFNADDHVFVMATFEPSSEVFVGMEGSGEGSVVSDPPGIDCPDADCFLLVFPGTQVTLTAQAADPWYFFTGWGGDVDCPGTGPCTFNATDHVHVSANFEHGILADIFLEGDGQGTVTSDPQGVDCPDQDCYAYFAPGTILTLRAAPIDSQYMFVEWSGVDECGDEPECTFELLTDTHAWALFEPDPQYLFGNGFESAD